MPNIIVRTLSGAVYVALIIAAVLLPGFTAFGLIFGICMALCLWELRTITHPRTRTLNVQAGAHAHTHAPGYWWYVPMQLYILVAFFSLCCLMILPVFGAMKGVTIPESRMLVLLLFVSLWVNDTFAYLTGYSLSFVKSYHKHPMAPTISPNKSIEGLLGGLLMTAVLAWLASFYFQGVYTTKFLIVYCEIIALAGTLGDLLESKIKRLTGVKDSSNLIPGHGGFLDRLDSTLLAAPCALLYLLKVFNLL